MNFLYLESGGCTDTGRKRSHNEDALLLLPEQGMFCVADGMGGMHGGEIASAAVVDGLRKEFGAAPAAGLARSQTRRVEGIRKTINDASGWIWKQADERGVSGTGTTAVIMIFDPHEPGHATVLHAGDSRAYCFRRDRLIQGTTDHSVAAAAGLKNEKSLPQMFRGVITRAVGLEKTVVLEETLVDVEPDDIFLLCSDGLTKLVPDKTIARLLKDGKNESLNVLAKSLVDAANSAGGDDNTSVVLIRMPSALPPSSIAPAGEESAGGTENTQQSTPPQTTASTLPVPPRPVAPERPSEPHHVSGITPAGDPETPTMATVDSPRDPPPAEPTRAAPPEKTEAPKKAADEKKSGFSEKGAMILIAALLVLAGYLWVQRNAEKARTEKKSAGPEKIAASENSAKGKNSPSQENPASEKIPAKEVAPANPVSSATNPAPVETVKKSDERAAATLAALKADVHEALLTGRWGELEKMPEVRDAEALPSLHDVREWEIYQAWLKEWKRVRSGTPSGRDSYSALREVWSPVFAAVGGDISSVALPQFGGGADAEADAFCAGAFSLNQHFKEAAGKYADARVEEVSRFESGLLPASVWLRKNGAEQKKDAGDSLAVLKRCAGHLQGWNANSFSPQIPSSPDAFKMAGEISGAVETGKDEFFDRLAEIIRGWGFAHMGDPAAGGNLRATFIRIHNTRKNAGANVRAWRTGGGEKDVLEFFQLLDAAFPEKK